MVDPAPGAPKTIKVTSLAFFDGDPIPKRNTCDGQDVSPPLRFAPVPPGTQTIALIMDDPDAPRGTWTHWTFWNLPATLSGLNEGADVKRLGAIEGMTDSRIPRYHGPCPPGGVHHYHFKLYAVNGTLELPPGAPLADLVKALQGKVAAWGELMGTYSR